MTERTANHCGLCPTSEKLREFLNDGADMHVLIFRRGNMIYSDKNNYQLGFQQVSTNYLDDWSMNGCKFFSNPVTQCKKLMRGLDAAFTGRISICEVDAYHIHERSDPHSRFNLSTEEQKTKLKDKVIESNGKSVKRFPFGYLQAAIHPNAFKGLPVRPRQNVCYEDDGSFFNAAFPQINVRVGGEWIEPLLCQDELENNMEFSVKGKKFFENRVRLPEHVEILNDNSTGQVFDHLIDEHFMVEFINDIIHFKTAPSDYPNGDNYHHPFSFQVTVHENSNCSVLMTQKGADGYVYKPNGYVYDDALGRYVEE
jgi:hypothetical protein